MTSSDTALADAPVAEAETPAAGTTPEQRAQQFQAFMAKIMGDMSRIRQQVDYSSRHFHAEIVDTHGRLDHLEGVLGMICEALHIEMPKRRPKLIDARVEVVEAIEEGEVCELQAAYSATAHPVFGHYQFLIGPANEQQVAQAQNFDPIVVQRIDEAFTALRATEGFKDGAFYYVRLGLLHAQPINETSVPVTIGQPAEAAANDDAAPNAMESGDVQSE